MMYANDMQSRSNEQPVTEIQSDDSCFSFSCSLFSLFLSRERPIARQRRSFYWPDEFRDTLFLPSRVLSRQHQCNSAVICKQAIAYNRRVTSIVLIRKSADFGDRVDDSVVAQNSLLSRTNERDSRSEDWVSRHGIRALRFNQINRRIKACEW